MDSNLGTVADIAGQNSMLYGFNNRNRNEGGLYAGNSVLAAEAHANGTAIGANIDSLTNLTRFGQDSVEEQIRESRTLDQFTGIKDNQFRAELRGSDQIAALTREVNNNARVTDACCCATKEAIANAAKDAAKTASEVALQTCRDHSELKALVISENGATRELIRGDALIAAQAEIASLKIENAINCRKSA